MFYPEKKKRSLIGVFFSVIICVFLTFVFSNFVLFVKVTDRISNNNLQLDNISTVSET